MEKRQIVNRGCRGCPGFLPAALMVLFLAAPLAASETAPSGIVIEEAQPGMTAQAAGLRPGDVLLSWRREAPSAADSMPTAGALELPFDLAEVFIEQVPRGAVVLEGRRAGLPISWTLPAGAPSDLRAVRTAPLRLPEALAQDRLARSGIDPGIQSSLSTWRAAATMARERGDQEVAVWLLVQAAHAAGRKGLWGEADTLYGQALSAQDILKERPPQERRPQPFRGRCATDEPFANPRSSPQMWHFLRGRSPAAPRAAPSPLLPHCPSAR